MSTINVENELASFPLFEDISLYQTNIATQGDPADIYYPAAATETDDLPIALFLQGALVDKAEYSNFAETVASYGFVVVVPNHIQSFPEFGITGFLPEVSQIDAVLTYLESENSRSTSPLEGILDTNSLSLLGHSQGGAVGLSAVSNYCIPFLCNETEFALPEEVVGGAFYGAFLQGFEGEFLPIDNRGIPLALISGSRDGVSTPEEIQASYRLIQDPPNALITVEGANHYGITNEDNLRDPLRPTLEQNAANEIIARSTGLFLRANVLDDSDAAMLLNDPNFDNSVSTIAQTRSVSESNTSFSILALGIVFLSLATKQAIDSIDKN